MYTVSKNVFRYVHFIIIFRYIHYVGSFLRVFRNVNISVNFYNPPHAHLVIIFTLHKLVS